MITSCAGSHYHYNKHKLHASLNRQKIYTENLKKNKHLYTKHKEANRSVDSKESEEWSYRREISGSNDIRNPHKDSGGYGD